MGEKRSPFSELRRRGTYEMTYLAASAAPVARQRPGRDCERLYLESGGQRSGLAGALPPDAVARAPRHPVSFEFCQEATDRLGRRVDHAGDVTTAQRNGNEVPLAEGGSMLSRQTVEQMLHPFVDRARDHLLDSAHERSDVLGLAGEKDPRERGMSREDTHQRSALDRKHVRGAKSDDTRRGSEPVEDGWVRDDARRPHDVEDDHALAGLRLRRPGRLGGASNE